MKEAMVKPPAPLTTAKKLLILICIFGGIISTLSRCPPLMIIINGIKFYNIQLLEKENLKLASGVVVE
ncbi:MAG: hypothetical protein FGF48_11010 [Candidatus Brockarchaeota archaeon]|nr:hypothetical protein [Candidatus Brockarchaeota archaeon]